MSPSVSTMCSLGKSWFIVRLNELLISPSGYLFLLFKTVYWDAFLHFFFGSGMINGPLRCSKLWAGSKRTQKSPTYYQSTTFWIRSGAVDSVLVLREGVVGKTGWMKARGRFQLVLRHNVLAVFRHMTAAADRERVIFLERCACLSPSNSALLCVN